MAYTPTLIPRRVLARAEVVNDNLNAIAAAIAEVPDGTMIAEGRQNFYTTAGTATAYTVTASPAPTAYVTGMSYRVKIHDANTGAATVNINSLGARTIKTAAGAALAAGDLALGVIVDLTYDGTDFRVVSAATPGLVKQTSVTDATADRLLITGAFGLGGRSTQVTSEGALDGITVSGWNHFAAGTSATVGGPSTASSGLVLTMIYNTGADAVQKVYELTGNGGKEWTRSQNGGTWGAWKRTGGPFVGAVSEAGGVSTGDIIETGSNGNGKYTRFADGTQVCFHAFATGSVVALGAGTFADPYRSATVDWTFPAEFKVDFPVASVTPALNTTTGTQKALYPVVAARSLTGLTGIQVFRGSSDTTASNPFIYLRAVGRWF